MKRKTIAHYEIQRRLGAGGSGVVYAANDTLLQRPVVLKMLHTGLADSRAVAIDCAARGAPGFGHRASQCVRNL